MAQKQRFTSLLEIFLLDAVLCLADLLKDHCPYSALSELPKGSLIWTLGQESKRDLKGPFIPSAPPIVIALLIRTKGLFNPAIWIDRRGRGTERTVDDRIVHDPKDDRGLDPLMADQKVCGLSDPIPIFIAYKFDPGEEEGPFNHFVIETPLDNLHRPRAHGLLTDHPEQIAIDKGSEICRRVEIDSAREE